MAFENCTLGDKNTKFQHFYFLLKHGHVGNRIDQLEKTNTEIKKFLESDK